MPWVYIEPLHATISGVHTEGTIRGRPFMFFMPVGLMMALMFLIPRLWAKRTNFFLSALSLAYALRTFIVFPLCEMGYCPEKKTGIYLMLLFSLLCFVMSMLPDMKIETVKRETGNSSSGL
jgi:hypothetical protein